MHKPWQSQAQPNAVVVGQINGRRGVLVNARMLSRRDRLAGAGRLGLRLLGVHRVHAHLARRGKELAAHVLGPLEAELLHVTLAAVTHSSAHRSTRLDRLRVV